MSRTYPIVIACGGGSEDWIFVNGLYPSRHLPEAGTPPLSFFQATCTRLRVEDGFAAPSIICNFRDFEAVERQLAQIGTAPRAIIARRPGLASGPIPAELAQSISLNDADAIAAVLPASHVIEDVSAFAAAVKDVARADARQRLVLFVAGPEKAAVADAYVRRGRRRPGSPSELYILDADQAAPDTDDASFHLGKAGYFWNSGIAVTNLRLLVEASGPTEHGCASTAAVSEPSNSVISADCLEALGASRRVSLKVFDGGWKDASRWTELLEVSSLTGQDGIARTSDRTMPLDLGKMIESPDVVVVANADNLGDVATLMRDVRNATPLSQPTPEASGHWSEYACQGQESRYRIKLMPLAKESGSAPDTASRASTPGDSKSETIYIAPSASHDSEKLHRMPLVELEVEVEAEPDALVPGASERKRTSR